jgi:N-acetylmuramoyl-L-alanine amidase
MAKPPRPVWFAAIVAIVLSAAVRPVLAQSTDRDVYTSALARERAARTSFEDVNAPADVALAEVRAVVRAYLALPNRRPASGFSDNALWQAGRLSLDAFARFGDERDRKTGVRLLKRLAEAYPASKMAKLVPATIDGAEQAVAAGTPPAERTPEAVVVRNPVESQIAAAGASATIRGIKRTVLTDVVRIVIELDTEVQFHEERIASPDRVFLDLTPARAIPALRNQTIRFQSDADVVRQVRLGVHENRTTRVVLDAGGVASYSVYALYNPYRLVIDCVRGTAPEPLRPVLAAKLFAPPSNRHLPSAAPQSAKAIRDAMVIPPSLPRAVPVLPKPAEPAASLPRAAAALPKPLEPTPTLPRTAIASPKPIEPPPLLARPAELPPGPKTTASEVAVANPRPGVPPARTSSTEVSVTTPPLLTGRSVAPPWSRRLTASVPRSTAAIHEAVASLPPPTPASPLGPGTIAPEKLPGTNTSALGPASPPARNSNGGFSIARQLGLSVSRIVIDPGHGGYDPGATGKDVTEAELVLDVALRLEKLLEKLPGVEVVLTRRTDEYVPLQERTALANREGADLFLSIHANASESGLARGVETYFLNFANNLSAASVAARENAASGQAMAALPDLVKMIALNNKLDESRDLATMVQRSMIERLRGANKTVKDLGVKQAPFVVLIGAAMPSVLTEVSFVTNPQDAKQLRSSSYRQRIAEALSNAVRKYQTSLKSVTTVAYQ